MNEPIYLDHAATTPLAPEVRQAMEPYLREEYGNPSSIHRLGQRARMAVDEGREQIAAAIGADPSEIVFTSGGTESDNAAIRGAAFARSHISRRVVTTSIEHEAVLETCDELSAQHGAEVVFIAPDAFGIISVGQVQAAIEEPAALVSVMYANNEVGTIQPVADIGAACRERGVPFHVDAVQAVGVIPIDVKRDSIDLMSISAHKFHGPKGVGALYVRKGTPWRAQQLGGGQERLRRSGTENVTGIVGMARALQLAVEFRDEAAARMLEMRQFLVTRFAACCPGAVVNGSTRDRLPGNVNISCPGILGESLVMALDAQGVMVSTGSACSSGTTDPSHVLLAMGCPPEVAAGAIRLTLGRETTWAEIHKVAELVPRTVERLRHIESPTPRVAVA
ncbi:MAG TPA: cysteine desulfurase family protein [Chloroflexota bacterium]|nr:cysteine desulfurase family protein [Chloroflexota bacterium]